MRHSINDTFCVLAPCQNTPLDCGSTDPRVLRIDINDDREGQTTICVPGVKRLSDFDCSANANLNPATLATLAVGAFIDAGTPVCLIGNSGTGKSHLLIGTGIAAAEAGRRVRYVTCAALVNELAEAADDHVLSRVVGCYGRMELLCLDELGYVSLDPRGAELLFLVITEREERASIMCASNASFSEWGATFTDPRLAAAVVDRMTFRALIIETGSDSYRLRASRGAKARTAKTTQPDSARPNGEG